MAPFAWLTLPLDGVCPLSAVPSVSLRNTRVACECARFTAQHKGEHQGFWSAVKLVEDDLCIFLTVWTGRS